MSTATKKLGARANWVMYLSVIATLSGGCASTLESVAQNVGQDLGKGVERAMDRAFDRVEPLIEGMGTSLGRGVEHATGEAFVKLQELLANDAKVRAEYDERVADQQSRDRELESLKDLVHGQQAALTKGNIQIEALKDVQEQLPRMWVRISDNKRDGDQDRIASIEALETRLREGTRDILFLIGALVGVSTLVVTAISAARKGQERNAGGKNKVSG